MSGSQCCNSWPLRFFFLFKALFSKTCGFLLLFWHICCWDWEIVVSYLAIILITLQCLCELKGVKFLLCKQETRGPGRVRTVLGELIRGLEIKIKIHRFSTPRVIFMLLKHSVFTLLCFYFFIFFFTRLGRVTRKYRVLLSQRVSWPVQCAVDQLLIKSRLLSVAETSESRSHLQTKNSEGENNQSLLF